MDKKIYLEWYKIHECVSILFSKIINDYPNIDSEMGLL
jgi:hypothetical protein